MRSCIFVLLLVLCVSSQASKEERTSTTVNLRNTPLGKAVLEEDRHALRREIKKLLDGSAKDFFKVINSVTESGENIFLFSFTSWMEKLFRNNELPDLVEEVVTDRGNREYPTVRRQLEDPKSHFSVVNELTSIITPYLGTKDKQGRDALVTAKTLNNQPVSDVLLKYSDKSEEMPELSETQRFKTHLWGFIPQITLEDTPLAQGVLQEDPQAFHKALQDLYLGTAANLLAVLHSKTKEGDTLFHLVAKVQSHQEEFARGIEEFMEFIELIDMQPTDPLSFLQDSAADVESSESIELSRQSGVIPDTSITAKKGKISEIHF